MSPVREGTRRPARAALSICLAVALIAADAAPLGAQHNRDREPPRPQLRAAADTNEWLEYHNYAMSVIVTRPQYAADALYWAERLDPTRAEPMYARWAALWMIQPQLLKDYSSGAERVLNSPSVQRIDSLNYTARLRNPMVNQGVRRLVLHKMYDHVFGEGNWEWNRDPEMLAWLDYTEGKYTRAVAQLGKIIGKDPEKHYALRYDRALTFYAMQQYDSAAMELTQLVEAMHKRDQKKLVYFYDSKAMFEYAAGVMYAEGRKFEPARQAFMRALSEDLAFYPAHRALGAMSLVLGDTAMAISEYQQALELNPSDLVTRYNFALVLMNAGQRDQAVELLKAVVEAEPYFAAPWYYLARILDVQGKHAEAMTYYTGFIPRAPKSVAPGVVFAQKRIAEFSAAGIVPVPARVAGQ